MTLPLLVFGFRKLPFAAVHARLTERFSLNFVVDDSLCLGSFGVALSPSGERWQLHQNFNLLENAWLEDAARDCDVLLYVGDITGAARAQTLRHQVLADFPSARELPADAAAAADLAAAAVPAQPVLPTPAGAPTSDFQPPPRRRRPA